MKKQLFILILILSAVCLCGCGKWMETKGDVSERNFPVKADNPAVKEFNKQLGEISDEVSAEKAVNSFVNYVDSRLVKDGSGSSIQSFGSLVRPETIKEMAKREAITRNVAGTTIMSEGEMNPPLIDIGTITDSVNELGSSEGIRVDDETVTAAKVAVEGSIPNLNKTESSNMTPLEAAVVGYALVSGDDGTASSESVDLPGDKMNTFVETITN